MCIIVLRFVCISPTINNWYMYVCHNFFDKLQIKFVFHVYFCQNIKNKWIQRPFLILPTLVLFAGGVIQSGAGFDLFIVFCSSNLADMSMYATSFNFLLTQPTSPLEPTRREFQQQELGVLSVLAEVAVGKAGQDIKILPLVIRELFPILHHQPVKTEFLPSDPP